MYKTATLTAALALILASLALPLQARDLNQDEALRLRREGVIQPLQQLVRQAVQIYPGARLLEVELDQEGQEYIYEVELLTADGQVRELELDARTGRLLKDEEED